MEGKLNNSNSPWIVISYKHAIEGVFLLTHRRKVGCHVSCVAPARRGFQTVAVKDRYAPATIANQFALLQ